MTSIFADSFSYNLDRVNSSAKQASKNSKGEKVGQDNFARLLADYEQKPEKPSNNNILPEEKKGHLSNDPRGEGNLSNLGSKEEARVRARLSPKMQGLDNDGSGLTIGRNFGGEAVKIPSKSVNSMPPKAILPGPPQLPSIISAKRVPFSAYRNQVRLQPELKKDEIKDIIVTAGKFHGVDPDLSLAVAQAESSFDSKAVSKDGHYSKGIFQLLDSTAQDMMNHTGVAEEYEPFDPGMNAFLGVGYLRRLMDIFSSSTKLSATKSTIAAKSSLELEKLAVAAFNAGQGNVVRAQERALELGKDPSEFQSIEPHLPASTREYVRRVTRIRESMQGNARGNALA